MRGRFLKLYVVIDIRSRRIVGAEVHEHEDAALAAALVERCCIQQGVRRDQLVLHADNGGAMKGNTMLAQLQQLGEDVAVLAHRHAVYIAARERHPERWTGKTRNWTRSETVSLNPSPSSRKSSTNSR